mmetsp:Transcript_15372/g.50279  ORF Transcript_15372/g.50279 Transcript_15372/m.50279 type:complete len:426 (-) Transcript_15372:873-2150(-)
MNNESPSSASVKMNPLLNWPTGRIRAKSSFRTIFDSASAAFSSTFASAWPSVAAPRSLFLLEALPSCCCCCFFVAFSCCSCSLLRRNLASSMAACGSKTKGLSGSTVPNLASFVSSFAARASCFAARASCGVGDTRFFPPSVVGRVRFRDVSTSCCVTNASGSSSSFDERVFVSLARRGRFGRGACSFFSGMLLPSSSSFFSSGGRGDDDSSSSSGLGDTAADGDSSSSSSGLLGGEKVVEDGSHAAACFFVVVVQGRATFCEGSIFSSGEGSLFFPKGSGGSSSSFSSRSTSLLLSMSSSSSSSRRAALSAAAARSVLRKSLSLDWKFLFPTEAPRAKASFFFEEASQSDAKAPFKRSTRTSSSSRMTWRLSGSTLTSTSSLGMIKLMMAAGLEAALWNLRQESLTARASFGMDSIGRPLMKNR